MSHDVPPERPEAPAFRVAEVMEGDGFRGSVPASAVQRILCFVGSAAVSLDADGATRAYRALNPAWPGGLSPQVVHAAEEHGDAHACALACLKVAAKGCAASDTLVQTYAVNVAALGRSVILCFATTLGRHGGRTGVFLLDDEIPFR